MAAPIATSKIAKQAFIFMEMSPISSFADGSEQATLAADMYPVARDIALEEYDWSFARILTQRVMADLPPEFGPDPDLPYACLMPGDCIKLRQIYPEPSLWRLDGQVLRIDQASGVTIRYTRRIENETEMPASFQMAVAAQLAFLLSSRFVTTRTKKNDLLATYGEMLDKAKLADRQMASPARYDGQGRQGDWASEATL